MNTKKLLLWIGIGIIALNLALAGLSFVPDLISRSDPAIIFLTLAAVFMFIQFAAPAHVRWTGWLHIPSALFLAFGIVFFFNAVTSDWGSWAYAWLLCLAGLGIGLALAVRATGQFTFLFRYGLWGAAACAGLSGVFGAIAGGAFMRVFSLVLLVVMAGLVVWAFRAGLLTGSPTEQDAGKPQPAQGTGLEHSAAQPLAEPLSRRELEVLQWIEQGLTNAEIASRMVVATSTVKTHINNIYAKLEVQTRTQAIRKARDLGLL